MCAAGVSPAHFYHCMAFGIGLVNPQAVREKTIYESSYYCNLENYICLLCKGYMYVISQNLVVRDEL